MSRRIDAHHLTGPEARRGRGAVHNPEGRFAATVSEAAADGWETDPEVVHSIATEVRPESARSIISRNESPDIPFTQSINPYRGCEHGCVYCYARPAHAYMDLSPGLDFETRLFYKKDAACLLRKELARPGYICSPIALGSNTDPYQPQERRLRITRSLLEVCLAHRHPVTLTTKGMLILDDLPLIKDLARQNLVQVAISLTTLDDELKRILEPRAADARGRLKIMRHLRDAGVPVSTLIAPVIPAINDAEIEALLQAAAEAGAGSAHWILLRLPHEVRELFMQWLQVHFPERSKHVLSLIEQSRNGQLNDPRFGSRMRGSGHFVQLITDRFRIARRRLGLDAALPKLDCASFQAPADPDDRQMKLF